MYWCYRIREAIEILKWCVTNNYQDCKVCEGKEVIFVPPRKRPLHLSNGNTLPEWFQYRTGFQFRDPSGDLFVLLGYAGYREVENIGSVSIHDEGTKYNQALFKLELKSASLLAGMCYKGEFHIVDLMDEDFGQSWWDDCSPVQEGVENYLLDCTDNDGETVRKRDWYWFDHSQWGVLRQPYKRK